MKTIFSSMFVLLSIAPILTQAKTKLIASRDSLGVENRIDKTIVLHQVEEGQTLYSILKRYTCSYKDYVSENPGQDLNIGIGQILRIPTTRSIAQAVKNDQTKKYTPKPADNQGGTANGTPTTTTKDKSAPSKIEGSPITKVVKPSPEYTPKTTENAASEPVVKTTKPKADALKVVPIGAKTHVIESKQTLFFIANKYNTTVENLKIWNNLPSNDVQIGQILAVSKPKGWKAAPTEKDAPVQIEKPRESAQTKEVNNSVETEKTKATAFKKEAKKTDTVKTEEGRTVTTQEDDEPTSVLAKMKPNKPDDIKTEENRLKEETRRLALEQKEREKEALAKKAEEATETPKVVVAKPKKADDNDEDRPRPAPSHNMKEDGLAGLIDIQGQSEKYLALHRTAPVGTIIQVTNLTNNRTVQVKVIGRLPDTGINDKYVIKISPKAFDKLNPIDKKIRAELNW